MEFNLKTDGRIIEVVNFILGQAFMELSEKPNLHKRFDLTAKDVVKIETFRKKLLKEYFKK
ncbi:MAG: hypothetical protein LBE36_06510 [Flavobacteriaceae bacterium]|jgi:hypothetical protein|nr:hypothetical protein [Flavobacteriaceae bacterium]